MTLANGGRRSQATRGVLCVSNDSHSWWELARSKFEAVAMIEVLSPALALLLAGAAADAIGNASFRGLARSTA